LPTPVRPDQAPCASPMRLMAVDEEIAAAVDMPVNADVVSIPMPA
jgi:hypothetical protein